jgi:alpha-tubulin suppressor-like RCC1 family protein
MALSAENRVYVWGSNSFGQFGIPSFAGLSSAVPREITGLYTPEGAAAEEDFSDILCGGISNFVTDAKGRVYGFGSGGGENAYLGYRTDELPPSNPMVNGSNVTAPVQVRFYKPVNIYEVTKNGDAAWLGKLPVDRTERIETEITALIGSVGVRTFVKDSDGNTWSWGDNLYAMACSGDTNACAAPVRSTLYRTENYDEDITRPNYLLRPIIGLCVIFGAAAAFFIRAEYKKRKLRKAELAESQSLIKSL